VPIKTSHGHEYFSGSSRGRFHTRKEKAREGRRERERERERETKRAFDIEYVQALEGKRQ